MNQTQQFSNQIHNQRSDNSDWLESLWTDTPLIHTNAKTIICAKSTINQNRGTMLPRHAAAALICNAVMLVEISIVMDIEFSIWSKLGSASLVKFGINH